MSAASDVAVDVVGRLTSPPRRTTRLAAAAAVHKERASRRAVSGDAKSATAKMRGAPPRTPTRRRAPRLLHDGHARSTPSDGVNDTTGRTNRHGRVGSTPKVRAPRRRPPRQTLKGVAPRQTVVDRAGEPGSVTSLPRVSTAWFAASSWSRCGFGAPGLSGAASCFLSRASPTNTTDRRTYDPSTRVLVDARRAPVRRARLMTTDRAVFFL